MSAKKSVLPKCSVLTKKVSKLLWKNRKIFVSLALLYLVAMALMVGVASQSSYTALQDTISTNLNTLMGGVWGEVTKVSLLFLASITGNITQDLTDVQQVYAGLITVYALLTNTWLIRNILAGHKVKLRDGLYSAGAPILPTLLISLIMIAQMLPVAVVIIGYSAASSVGLLDSSVEAIMFWFVACGLLALSLYWLIGTIFALVIVTLPGMYPLNAIKTANDLVNGRRMVILKNLIWMLFVVVLSWAVIVIPVMLLDTWVKGMWTVAMWVPLVPTLVTILGSITIIWVSSYIYMLYREVIASDSKSS